MCEASENSSIGNEAESARPPVQTHVNETTGRTGGIRTMDGFSQRLVESYGNGNLVRYERLGTLC